MLSDPPIEKLIKKAGCRYTLACAVSQRARALSIQEKDYLEESGVKPISLAAKEIYEGKIEIEEDSHN